MDFRLMMKMSGNACTSKTVNCAPVINFENRDELYKNRSSRKADSWRLLSREYDFPKTFSLTENQLSQKTYFYTISSRSGQVVRMPLKVDAIGYARRSARVVELMEVLKG